MRIEPGADHTDMDPHLTSRYADIDQVHIQYARREGIIVYARAGIHSPNSLHHKGRAIDLRTRDMAVGVPQQVRDALEQKLSSDFDIVLETIEPHIHIEYDPRDPNS